MPRQHLLRRLTSFLAENHRLGVAPGTHQCAMRFGFLTLKVKNSPSVLVMCPSGWWRMFHQVSIWQNELGDLEGLRGRSDKVAQTCWAPTDSSCSLTAWHHRFGFFHSHLKQLHSRPRTAATPLNSLLELQLDRCFENAVCFVGFYWEIFELRGALHVCPGFEHRCLPDVNKSNWFTTVETARPKIS